MRYEIVERGCLGHAVHGHHSRGQERRVLVPRARASTWSPTPQRSLAVALVLGLPLDEACAALASFTGVRRRFDLVGEVDGVTVVDDYAHHPTEVRCDSSGAARRARGLRAHLGALPAAPLQPHRCTPREFGEAFDECRPDRADGRVQRRRDSDPWGQRQDGGRAHPAPQRSCAESRGSLIARTWRATSASAFETATWY